MWHRKKMRLLGILAAALLLLVACGEGETAAPEDADDPVADDAAADDAAAPDEVVEIEFWTMLDHSGDDVRAHAEREMVANFEAENPDISVRVQSIPWEELPRQTIVAIETGTGPDVARLSFSLFRDYVEHEVLMPLNQFVEDWSEEERSDIVGWEATEFDGNKYSFIIAPLVNSVMYRTDLVEAAGVEQPQTWEEFAGVAQALTTDDVWGFAFALQPGADLIDQYFWPYLWGCGEEPFDAQEQPTWASECGQDAAQWLHDMMEVHQAMPPESLNLSLNDALEGFRAGRYAMIIDGSNRYGHATDSEITEGNVGLWEIPTADPGTSEFSPPQVLGWSLGVAQNTEHPEASWRFIEHMISNESNLINAQVASEIPSRASTLDDPWFDEPEAEAISWYVDYADRFPSQSPHVPGVGKIRSVLVQTVHEMVLQGTSPEAALQSAEQEYVHFLAEEAEDG